MSYSRRTPAMLAIRKAVRNLPEQHYVVGVSGGSDSLALVAACAIENKNVTAVIVDHQLQEGSDEVALRAKEQCEGLGVPTVIETVTVQRTSSGMEADARGERYKALFSHGDNVITGHTKDDQAETVLMGFGRGSGARSISGMSPVSERREGKVYRPMLGTISKEMTRTACAEMHLTFWDDPHNEDVSYRRVAVRRELLPHMDEVLGGGVVDSLCETASQVAAEHDFVVRSAYREYASSIRELLDAPRLNTMEKVLRHVIIAEFMRSHHIEVTSEYVRQIDAMIVDWKGQKGITVPGNKRIYRENNMIRFGQ